jgi:general secretion pathway protein H
MFAMKSSGLRRPAGTTLLELLVVMALLALVAAALPWALTRNSPAQRCGKAEQALLLQLRKLQLRAMREARALQMTAHARGLCIPAAGTDDCIWLHWEGVTTRLRPNPVSTSGTITWYPDGSSSGGTIELYSGDHVKRLSFSALTGRVRQP